jgi:hypothetical protein
MLRKLMLSVVLVAGTLGVIALTTSSAAAASPSASRHSYRSRVHGRYHRGPGWKAHTRSRHRYNGHRGVARGRYHARFGHARRR